MFSVVLVHFLSFSRVLVHFLSTLLRLLTHYLYFISIWNVRGDVGSVTLIVCPSTRLSSATTHKESTIDEHLSSTVIGRYDNSVALYPNAASSNRVSVAAQTSAILAALEMVTRPPDNTRSQRVGVWRGEEYRTRGD